MTEHDLKEMKNLGAELGAAKAEVERLRGLLSPVYTALQEWKPKSRKEMDAKNSAAVLLMDAISQQAEPVAASGARP